MNKKLEFSVVDFNDGYISGFTPYFQYETENGYFRFVGIELASCWHTDFFLPVTRGDKLSIIRDDISLTGCPLHVSIHGREGCYGKLREVKEGTTSNLTPEIRKYFDVANGSHYLDANLLRDGDRIVIESPNKKLSSSEELREHFLEILKMQVRHNHPMERSSCVFAFN